MQPATPVAVTESAIQIEAVDFSRPAHCEALVMLLDEYAQSAEGGATPLAPAVRDRICTVLAMRPHYAGWLAFHSTRPVGLINCFEGVSTFRAQPLLNVHDIVVSATHRRQGIGAQLLARAEQHARKRGCCKLTLEVLEGNGAALAVYARSGFRPYELDPAMGRALFLEKKFF